MIHLIGKTLIKTKIIIFEWFTIFGNTKQITPPPAVLKDINRKYYILLKCGHNKMLNNCLIFYRPIMMNSKYLALIVVPQSLQKRIFDHYHSEPTNKHMIKYKTLYRMRSRFYWPKIRDDIKTWVHICAHCTTYNVWRNRKSELYFSWPTTMSL